MQSPPILTLFPIEILFFAHRHAEEMPQLSPILIFAPFSMKICPLIFLQMGFIPSSDVNVKFRPIDTPPPY